MQRDVRETVMKYVFLISALISVLSIILIFYFIFSGGLPFILRQGVWEFLTGTNWRPTASQPEFGILPMIVGSLIVTGGAILIGVPIGVLTAVYMVFYCPKAYYRYAKSAINLMAAIPSIVYGFFALQIFVPFFRIMGRSGMNMVTASLLLGIMILPTIIGLSESAIRNVPKSYYQRHFVSHYPRDWPGYWGNHGRHPGGGEPTSYSYRTQPRGSDPDNQYRHGNGLCNRPAPGSLNRHSRGPLRLHSDY